MSSHPVIALTPGEPAGVGPDICIELCRTKPDCALVVIADPAMLAARAKALGVTWQTTPWTANKAATPGVYVEPVTAAVPTVPGKLDSKNSPYVLRTLERAIEGCVKREFDALVTGPVHKGIINDAGLSFTGHTEFLAERSNAPQPVMMLAAPGRGPSAAKTRDGRERPPDLRVALATTHLQLADVPRAITRERLTAVLRVLRDDLQTRFRIGQPRILVCGLNPHAGEGGHLGREEIDVIAPVIAQLRTEGMDLKGPVPADTAFLPKQLAEIDAVLAMYHDQGLPVLKHHDFAHAVNVTLGLPFVRTSVDHGTALELAGTGQADVKSLKAALDMASELCAR